MTDNTVSWQTPKAIVLVVCTCYTAFVFWWYVKLLIEGETTKYPVFIFSVSVALLIEYALLFEICKRPLWPLIAFHLWPIILVIGFGTGFVFAMHLIGGAVEWLAYGTISQSRFADYLYFLDIHLSETTTALGWNKIAHAINNLSILTGEVIVAISCFVLFFLMFVLVDAGADREK